MRCQAIGLPEGACAVARAQAVATLTDRRRDRMRGWYRIENVADPGAVGAEPPGNADIFIYDEIVSQEEADFCGIGISATSFVAALQELKGQALTVHINSPGGLVFDGIAIANALRAHDGQVNVIVDGIAASIASVIAMAGDTVTMAPHAMLMIHEAMGMTLGNAADHEQQAMVLNKLSENIAGVYAERGDKRVNWRQKMQAETWLTDKEAVDLGLADRIDVKISPASNDFDLSQYRNAPNHLVGAGKRPVFLAVNSLTLRGVSTGYRAKAIAVHHTDTSNGAWDGPANEARIPNDATAETLRLEYAWNDPGKNPDTKAAYKGVHHEVGADGTIGAANLDACSQIIGELNGGRGGFNIPVGDRQGVWEHAAAHLKDAHKDDPNYEPPPLKDDAALEAENQLTIRAAERALRDAGFSNSQARTIVAKGWHETDRDDPPNSSGMDEPEPEDDAEQVVIAPSAAAQVLIDARNWEALYARSTGLSLMAKG